MESNQDCVACRELLRRVEQMSRDTLEQQRGIAQVLDEKLDTLVQAVAKPIDTFRWLVIALLLMLFVERFGLAGLDSLTHSMPRESKIQ